MALTGAPSVSQMVVVEVGEEPITDVQKNDVFCILPERSVSERFQENLDEPKHFTEAKRTLLKIKTNLWKIWR
jgi:hypothetical protein